MPLREVHPNDDERADLLSLCQYTCVMLHCNLPPSAFVTNESKGVSLIGTCAPLCSHHLSDVRAGRITGDLIRALARFMRPIRLPQDAASTRVLRDRNEFQTEVASLVRAAKHSLRIVFVGPMPFHPEWLMKLTGSREWESSLENATLKCLESTSIDVKIILRNHKRYLNKLSGYLPSSLVSVAIQGITDRISELSQEPTNRVTVGSLDDMLNIPVIVDDVFISALRRSPLEPIDGALMMSGSQDLCEWETRAFDTLFNHYASKSRDTDVSKITESFLKAGLN